MVKFNSFLKKDFLQKGASPILAFLVVVAIILIVAFANQPEEEPASQGEEEEEENGSGSHYHYTPPSSSNPPSPSPSNQNPEAYFSCSPSDCSAYAGPPDPSDPSLTLENKSTDPNGNSDIIKSEWDVLNYSGGSLDCPDRCNYTVQNSLFLANNYEVKLTVTDKGGKSNSFIREIRIKKDIVADFECSLSENGPWIDCEEFKGIQEEYAYFKNTSTLSESENANGVSSWLWKLDDVPFSSGSGGVPIVSVVIPGRSNTVELTLTDNKGRTDSTSYSFGAKLPLPTWQEVGN